MGDRKQPSPPPVEKLGNRPEPPPAPPPKRCGCCWHYSSFQHAVTNHRDEVCCHCGTTRCVSVQPKIPLGHGPYCPERVS